MSTETLPITTRLNVAHRARKAASEYARSDALMVMDDNRVAEICAVRSPRRADGSVAWARDTVECKAFTETFWRSYHTALVG